MTNLSEGAEKPIPEKPKSESAPHEKKSRLAQFSLAALGVVLEISVPTRYTPFGSVSTVNTALPGLYFEERFLLGKCLSIAGKHGFKTVHGIVVEKKRQCCV
jgi:hypothetical protein